MEKRYETVSSERGTLTRKIGEGSFVGYRRANTPEELVEWLKHLRAYRWAENFAEGKCVLDVGCGVGYGANELSTKASAVVGIDFWKEGIHYCHQNYGKNMSPLVASGIKCPFKDDSFDLAVSFQVIEHIAPEQVATYLYEIKRVLKPGGTFVVVTPNKLLRLLPFQKPWNPDHKKEYDAKELKSVLTEVFGNMKILGLSASEEAYLIEYNRVKQSPLRVYLLDPAAGAMLQVLPRSIIFRLKTASSGKEKLLKDQRSTILNCKLSLSNFQISDVNLRSSIDIYGICTKAGV